LALSKETEDILTKTTLGPSTTTTLSDCTRINLETAAQFAVEVSASFDNSSMSALRVHLRSSADGSNYDSVDIGPNENGYFDLDAGTGKPERKTAPVWPDFRYLKVLAENRDTSATVHSLTVTKIVQTVEPT